MTQNDKLMHLISYLLNENENYSHIQIPISESDRKNLLRSLFNVRPPKPISDEFLKIQDAYLQKEIKERGIIDYKTLSPTAINDKIYLWQGDITTLKIGAIVNAANSALLGCFQPCHSCIDNIIHTLSGVQLRLECDKIMQNQGHEEETGTAKITSAYNLPSDYVIHTVGPIISGKLTDKDRALLANCYRSCLELAVKNEIESIAFCCISTGVFCFPQDEAAKIAVDTVIEFLKQDCNTLNVVFNVFTDRDLKIYQSLLSF